MKRNEWYHRKHMYAASSVPVMCDVRINKIYGYPLLPFGTDVGVQPAAPNRSVVGCATGYDSVIPLSFGRFSAGTAGTKASLGN